MMGVNTRNMYSCLQKYNKLNTVASCWTVIKFKPMQSFLSHFEGACIRSTVLVAYVHTEVMTWT